MFWGDGSALILEVVSLSVVGTDVVVMLAFMGHNQINIILVAIAVLSWDDERR